MFKYFYTFIILLLLGGIIFKMFYQDINIIKNPDDLLVIVNKNNKLPKNFIPKNLQKISLEYSNKDKYLVRDACIQFENLSAEAKKQGYKIIAVSTYRSEDYQKKLFDNYTKEKGIKHTLLYSAKAGHSEHQTGLAVDVMGSNNNYNFFEDSIEFDWMINNAHKFGFILRYPQNKTTITGFAYEPWHYRYVGKTVAKYIYENKITLEEYKKIND